MGCLLWCLIVSSALYVVQVVVRRVAYVDVFFFVFSSRRRHTRCALVTGVQTCALPICVVASGTKARPDETVRIAASSRPARCGRSAAVSLIGPSRLVALVSSAVAR